jgi:rhodanese-related sulfurtransferase
MAVVTAKVKRVRLIAGLVALSVIAGAGFAAAQAMRNVPRITVDELKTLIDQKAVVIIDVRDPGQFKEGRIPGSVNIDYTEMPGKAKQFKGETRTIVAYCACVGDTTAARAALDMAAAGVPGARALAGGWNEWVKRGERIER